MDRATLTDNNGREADFRNTILIMTSNAGAREMSQNVLGFGKALDISRGNKAIERMFSPEFRNRLDSVVWFERLPMKAILRVVDKFVIELEGQLAEREVTFDLTQAAREWLADRGYDEAMGARPMGRIIHTHIKEPLADEILFGKLKDGGRVKVDVAKDGESLAFTFPKKAIEGKDPKALPAPEDA